MFKIASKRKRDIDEEREIETERLSDCFVILFIHLEHNTQITFHIRICNKYVSIPWERSLFQYT